MKKYLRFTSYFLLILVALNILLYLISKEIYSGSYQNYSLNYNSYLFADSHGKALDRVTEKYGVYNFSAGSDSYFDMHRKIEFLVEKTKIDTIYLSVDDHTLSLYREGANNLDRSHVFATLNASSSYYEFLKVRYLKNYIVLFQPRTRSVIRQYLISKLKKLSVKNNKVLSTSNDKPLEWENIGGAERQTKSKNRLDYQFPSDIVSANLRASLQKIMNSCEANNIVLIGVKFPLSFDYNKILGDRTYGADQVLRANGFHVIDYKEVFTDHNDYFKNQDHLNQKGSHYLVEKLLNRK